MADINSAFTTYNGISLDDIVGVFQGTDDPTSGAGEAAPVGSLFLRTNGELYQKTGVGDTAWSTVGSSGSGIQWQGEYVSGATYNNNDMVRDGAWTMIANATTTDRAAPTPDGDTSWALPDAPSWTNQTATGISYSGAEWTLDDPSGITSLRFWLQEVGANISNVGFIFDITDGANPVLIASQDFSVVQSTGWVSFNIPDLLFTAGTKLRIVLVTNKYSSSSSWSYRWTYDGVGSGDPGSSKYRRNSSFSKLYIHEVDEDSTNRATDLANLKAGDILRMVEEDSSARFNEYEIVASVDQGSYYELDVNRIDNGSSVRSGNVATISATINSGILPAPYVELANWWLENNPDDGSTIRGFATDTYPPTGGDLNDNAYGIDLQTYTLTSSPDWEVVSFSGSVGGSTSNSGGETEGVQVESRHNGAITQTITTVFSPIFFNSTTRENDMVSYSNGTFTVNEKGRYRVTADLTATVTSNTRTTSEWKITTSVLGDVPGTFGYAYHRNLASGENTITIRADIEMEIGDTFQVEGHTFSGANIDTIAESCRITIEKG